MKNRFEKKGNQIKKAHDMWAHNGQYHPLSIHAFKWIQTDETTNNARRHSADDKQDNNYNNSGKKRSKFLSRIFFFF